MRNAVRTMVLRAGMRIIGVVRPERQLASHRSAGVRTLLRIIRIHVDRRRSFPCSLRVRTLMRTLWRRWMRISLCVIRRRIARTIRVRIIGMHLYQ